MYFKYVFQLLVFQLLHNTDHGRKVLLAVCHVPIKGFQWDQLELTRELFPMGPSQRFLFKLHVLMIKRQKTRSTGKLRHAYT